jgi:hypothetical protein
MYPHRGKKVQLLDQEMDAILLIIGIVYRWQVKTNNLYFVAY